MPELWFMCLVISKVTRTKDPNMFRFCNDVQVPNMLRFCNDA